MPTLTWAEVAKPLTQLPLVAAPYAQVAADLGLTEATLLDRLAALKARGVIRRIAAAAS